jgi:hypothetical protein
LLGRRAYAQGTVLPILVNPRTNMIWEKREQAADLKVPSINQVL